ncbi:hypothetical protein [Dactylosporangium sp. NPDC049140]|uniref:RNA polymerase sigma factor n=1 Tax=Dactylosporangium sp. NPDC049140 TaxID=3155647 RepID=UPI0033CD3EEE
MSIADAALPADTVIVARLRGRDEAMFAALIDAWSPGLLRAAQAFVADEHAAQDVVQATAATRCANCCSCPRPTSGSCCTGAGPPCGPRWRRT